MSDAFKDWTREELIKFLEGTIESHNKFKIWIYKNHIKILRQYEDEELGGLRLELLNTAKHSKENKR